MNLNEKYNTGYCYDLFREHKEIRYLVYAISAVIGFWILGKAALSIADAVNNLKKLNNAFAK